MDKLAEIYLRQAAYVRSLIPTYRHNGFQLHTKSFPWDLDDRKCQEEFRLLAWRFTEEVIEAEETWSNRQVGAKQHYHEEIADALHFLIELCLASGVMEDELVSGIATVPMKVEGDRLDYFFQQASRNMLLVTTGNPWYWCLRALGLAMMQLRQRPWRKDFRETDRAKWVMGIHLTFQAFINACFKTDINAQDLHQAYFKKAKKNDDRIEAYGVRP